MADNTLNLTRKALGGIDFTDIQNFDELGMNEKQAMDKFLDMIYRSPMWKILLKKVIDTQKNYTVIEAENYDKVTFGRATISAMLMLDTLFKEVSNSTRLQKDVSKFDSSSAHRPL